MERYETLLEDHLQDTRSGYYVDDWDDYWYASTEDDEDNEL